MKRIITLLFLTSLVTANSFSQGHINYDRDSKWFLGFNGGGTWTSRSETQWRLQPGWGIVLGRSLGMKPHHFFSVDLRGRFLAAYFSGQSTQKYTLDSTSTGLDIYGSSLNPYKDSIGYFIPNYKTTLYSGSLELVLNTNRLREKTGWNFYLFGGIGIKGYHTAANLYDGDSITGNFYNYDNFGSTSKSSLLDKQDNTYETDLVGSSGNMEVTWMPSVGVGLSYQVTPWFALGLEHKMTWTRTNLFDGMPNNINGLPSGKNDIYHYSAVSLKFHLWGDGHGTSGGDVVLKDTNTVNPIVNPVIDTPKQKPIVDIFDPNTSPYKTTSEHFKIQANVYYVAGKSNITFKQNGIVNTNFYYNANTDQFYSEVVLLPGQNIFEITAVNEAGQDYKTTIIIYEKEIIQQKRPPIVTITNPPYSPYGTNNDIFGLTATVLEVDSKSQISVYLNGVILPAFSYNTTDKILNATLNLMEGVNTVTVSATNDVGSDSKTVQITYDKPREQLPPVVDFIIPATDPYLCPTSGIAVKATVLNVESKSKIGVRVNGFPTSMFSYNASSKEVNLSVSLNEGANVVEISGFNDVGSDVETTTIIYHKPEAPRPPIVTFVNPETDPITVYSPTYGVTAKVDYVASAADIELKINGVPSTLFMFSNSSHLMKFTTNLVEGSNVIQVSGKNKFGIDMETTTIIYKKEITKAPPIVKITNPSVDNKVYISPNMTLTANVMHVDNAANILVKFNGIATTAFSYNTATKVLVMPLTLNEGSNTVTITGTNSAGTDSDTRIIIHEKPKVPAPPTVTISSPASSPHLATTSAFTFTANTTNIESKEQITLMLNGSIVAAGAYTFTAAHQIIYPATLIAGNNVFTVIVTNEDGSADAMAIVALKEVDEPCVIPTVGYISPVPYSTVEEAIQNIDAQINNWSSETVVELQLNGVSQGYMTYNSSSSIASKGVTLNEGSNAIKVIVTNNCGTNHATFTLNYKKPDAPCNDPVLTAISPSSSGTYEESTTITASATYVSNASQIKVTLNGTTTPFTYDSGTGTITINAPLALGNNTILITAKTDCGTAVTSFNVIRKECLIPVISGISPTSGLETDDAHVTLRRLQMFHRAKLILLLTAYLNRSVMTLPLPN